jgi:1,3-beta-galactosyl-N-acetylhexosamine phosphorylase
MIEETKEIAERWGADALRDCDGTNMPDELKKLPVKTYSTYYTTRKDNAWAEANPEEIQQVYCYGRGRAAYSYYEAFI